MESGGELQQARTGEGLHSAARGPSQRALRNACPAPGGVGECAPVIGGLLSCISTVLLRPRRLQSRKYACTPLLRTMLAPSRRSR